jgi:hypothetical protein
MKMDSKKFLLFACLVAVGVVIYVETRPEKTKNPLEMQLNPESSNPSRAEAPVDVGANSVNEVPPSNSVPAPVEKVRESEPTSTQSSKVEQANDEALVLEAQTKSEPSKQFIAPTEKGQTWTNPNDVPFPKD